MPGPIILGRIQAKAMGYVQFPQIRQPHTLNTFEHTSTKQCITRTPNTKTAETAQEIRVPVHKATKKEITKTEQITQDYRTSTTKHQMGFRPHTIKW